MKICLTMYSLCSLASESVRRLITYLSKQKIKTLMQEIYFLKIANKTNQGISVSYELWFDKANL